METAAASSVPHGVMRGPAASWWSEFKSYRAIHLGLILVLYFGHTIIHYLTWIPDVGATFRSIPFFREHIIHEVEYLVVIFYAALIFGPRGGILGIIGTAVASVPFLFAERLVDGYVEYGFGGPRVRAAEVALILSAGVFIVSVMELWRSEQRRSGVRFPLGQKFMAGGIALTLVSIATLGLTGFWLGRSGVQSQVSGHLESVASLKRDALQFYLDEQHAVLEHVADDVYFSGSVAALLAGGQNDSAMAAFTQSAAEELAEYPALVALLVVDRDGRVVATAGTPEAQPANPLPPLTVSNGADAVFLPSVGATGSPHIAAVVEQIGVDFSPGGAVVGLLRAAPVHALLEPAPGQGPTGYVFLAAADGTPLFLPEAATPAGSTDPYDDTGYGYSAPAQAAPSPSTSSQAYVGSRAFARVPQSTADATLSGAGVSVIAGVPAPDAFYDIDRMRLFMMISAAVIGLGGAYAAWRYSRSVTHPLEQVMSGARRFGSGELHERIAVRSGDELGELANTFNRMAGDISNLYEDVARERKMLASIQSSMADGLVVLNPESNVLSSNPAAMRLLGLQQPPAGWEEIVAALRSQGALDPDLATAAKVAAGEEAAGLKLPSLNGRNDEDRYLHLSAFPISLGPDSQLRGLLIRDVTAQRQVEERRNAYVSIVSHELRNPMTSIIGYSELLLRTEANEALRQRALEHIHGEGRRLASLASDMLDVSNIQSGRITVKTQPVEIKSALETALTSATSSANGHRCVADISEAPPTVMADREKLVAVLVNLISNAVKYSPTGGTVTVRAAPEAGGGRALISVSDQGMGISTEDARSLFTPFRRIQRKETESIPGTGLGLYITKTWIELMGGTIWVESELGKGTTFYFSLPVAPQS